MKRQIFFILTTVTVVFALASCSSVKSSTQNFSLDIDDTEFIQKLLDSNDEKIVIPARKDPWIVRPLNITNAENKTFLFEQGCFILAKQGEFKDKLDFLLTIKDCKNIKLMGYGATLKMNKADYTTEDYPKSEWRHSIAIFRTTDLDIEGFKIQSSGGDGIYIGQGGNDPVCKNISLKDLILEDHHRQGISVVSVDGLLMENCSVFGTRGTLPQAGIDFEPNNKHEVLSNIILKNCTFRYNKGPGILIYLKKLDNDSKLVDISIENCVSEYNFLSVSIMKIPKNLKGKIEFKNTRVKGLQWIKETDDFKIISN